MKNQELEEMIKLAVEGDRKALEIVIVDIQDFVFNLSLRMLGTITDAQDATQDILIKVITNLSKFHYVSEFHTWVYRVATNYLIDYKKSMFAKFPLDFEYYANDIRVGYMEDYEELRMGLSQEELAEELKLSCTNVMLQCLNAKERCIFILGTMFHVDSKIAAHLLEMTPENYRQKLSRIRKKMAQFLSENCGLSKTGCCDCHKRVCYAIQSHRLDPQNLEYKKLPRLHQDLLQDYMRDMEVFEDKMAVFEDLPQYQCPHLTQAFIQDIINSTQMKKIRQYKENE